MSLADKIFTEAEIAWLHKPTSLASASRHQQCQSAFEVGLDSPPPPETGFCAQNDKEPQIYLELLISLRG